MVRHLLKMFPKNYMSDYKPSGNVVLSSVQYEPKEMLRTKSYYLDFVENDDVLRCRIYVDQSSICFVKFAAGHFFRDGACGSDGGFHISSNRQAVDTEHVRQIWKKDHFVGVVCIEYRYHFRNRRRQRSAVSDSFSCFLHFYMEGFWNVYPALSTDYFGTKNAGINYALVMIGFGLSSVLCPVLARASKEALSDCSYYFSLPELSRQAVLC